MEMYVATAFSVFRQLDSVPVLNDNKSNEIYLRLRLAFRSFESETDPQVAVKRDYFHIQSLYHLCHGGCFSQYLPQIETWEH